MAGAPFLSNVERAVALARERDPELLLLEGSGAALPPVAADRTVLVTSAARPAEALRAGLGPYRVLVSDVVVITMSEPPLADAAQVEAVRAAVRDLKPDATVIAAVMRPLPGRAGRGRAGGAVHHGRRARSTPGSRATWPTSTAPR